MEKPGISVLSFCHRDVICPSNCGRADNSLGMEKKGKNSEYNCNPSTGGSQDRQDSRSPIKP